MHRYMQPMYTDTHRCAQDTGVQMYTDAHEHTWVPRRMVVLQYPWGVVPGPPQIPNLRVFRTLAYNLCTSSCKL